MPIQVGPVGTHDEPEMIVEIPAEPNTHFHASDDLLDARRTNITDMARMSVHTAIRTVLNTVPIRHAGASSNEMEASNLRDIRMVGYAQWQG
jgi:hypothetical protein